MTATEIQRIARVLSNQTYCRHWLNFTNSHEDIQMAIQCRNHQGVPERIQDLEKLGFEESTDFLYTINRTNDDGTPFVSQIF